MPQFQYSMFKLHCLVRFNHRCWSL